MADAPLNADSAGTRFGQVGALNGRRNVSDEQLLSNLRAFIAPVAANAGAVTSDAEVRVLQ